MRKLLLFVALVAVGLAAAPVTEANWPRRHNEAATVVKVSNSDGTMHGTGFYIGAGKFVTAGHVASIGKELTLRNVDGSKLQATVDWIDEKRDVAVLTAKSPVTAPVAKLTCGVPDAPVGTPVFSIGYPLDLPLTETWGRVAANVTTTPTGERLLTADLLIGPGNSGGPVFDENGEVVGLSDAIFRGLGFALLVPRSEICAAMTGPHKRPVFRKPVTKPHTTGIRWQKPTVSHS